MRKPILFVEDNPVLLAMYGMMLEGEMDEWEVSTALSGAQALEMMEGQSFEVVVSDLRMPGMSGVELFNEVRRRFPKTSRIIVSGQQDMEEVAQCLASTHQFLSKPVDSKTLKNTLTRIGRLDAYLRDERLKALISQLRSMPCFPSLYTEVMRELSRPEPSVECLAASISKDPGLSAKVLQITNSPAMGLAMEVVDTLEAVEFLGFETIRSLVLSAHVYSAFLGPKLKGFSVQDLLAHGVRTGALARRLMEFEGAEPGDAVEAQTAGLLHDVGKLMLADSLPRDYARVLEVADREQIGQAEAELRVFGATHAGAAAYLLGLWGLPAGVVEAVAFHHDPSLSEVREFSQLGAVHVANCLAQGHSLEAGVNECAGVDMNYLAAIGMSDRLPAWRTESAEFFNDQK
jgi:HD-like signal output (HDOD) protein